MSGLSHTNHIYKQDKYDMKAKGSGKKDEDCVLYPKLNQPSNRPSFVKKSVKNNNIQIMVYNKALLLCTFQKEDVYWYWWIIYDSKLIESFQF